MENYKEREKHFACFKRLRFLEIAIVAIASYSSVSKQLGIGQANEESSDEDAGGHPFLMEQGRVLQL